MSLEPIEQIVKTIEQKKHILITTRANPDGDAISSALAFYLLLKKMGKKADVAIDTENFGPNKEYDFLANYQNISPQIKNNNDTIIEFDLRQSDIKGLTYKVKNNKLCIRVFSDNKNLELNAPKIKQEDYSHDLIVVLDSADLESLGKIYDEHAEFFYHAPIINIDHQADNEHFGELNFIELTAISTTEIIFNIIEALDKSMLDERLCTCILTGIIHESKSFQTRNITPRALAIASELITLGAKRELIIEKLFYNKPINTLQIWGKALANLKTNPEKGIIWSIISEKDFIETQTKESDLLSIIEDLLTQAPMAKIIILIYAWENSWKMIAHAHNASIDLRKILSQANAHGTKNFVEAKLQNNNPEDAINNIQNIITEQWPKEGALPKF